MENGFIASDKPDDTAEEITDENKPENESDSSSNDEN